jgi:hypothetical protein
MVKLTVGGGTGEGFEQLPAMRNVRWYLQSAELLPADTEQGYKPRIKWVFEIVGGDVPDDSFIGKTHHVYTALPPDPNKLSTRSNLYELVEGMSGGEFEKGDELDTDDYVGKEYTGNIKREPKRIQQGSNWIDSSTEKVSKLRDLFPAPQRQARASGTKQRGYDWEEGDAA